MDQTLKKEEYVGEAATVTSLFLAFLRLGLTAFGGPAIIAHIKDLAVARKQWIDEKEFKDGVVLSQSIPGATAMQVAAYVGLKIKGIPGAAAAYLGLGLPAFFLMIFLSHYYALSRTVAPVLAVFTGLQVIVVAIVAHSAFSFSKEVRKNAKGSLLAVLSAAALLFGADPFLVIVACAVAGAVIFKEISANAPPVPLAPGKRAARILLVAVLLGSAGLPLLYLTNGKLYSLALLMLRINFFAFGGGLSALPLMHHEIVARGWMDSKSFLDGIALGQVTPGPISITGTFIGYLLFGFSGAVAATIATFSPSFLLLLVSEPYWQKLKGSRIFARASKGIMSCFVGLLCYITYRFAREVSWDAIRAGLAAGAFVALYKKVDVLIIVVCGSLLSLLFL